MALPDAIKDAPELREDLIVYWEAFEKLSSCRQYGGLNGVPGPIPWTAINDYAYRHSFWGNAFDDLNDIIEALDEVYREHIMEKIKEDTSSDG